MAVDETRVTYRAVANFLALKKAVAAARKDLESLRKEETKTNNASSAGAKKVAAAYRDATKAIRSKTTATKTAIRSLEKHNALLKENSNLQKQNGTAAQQAAAQQAAASTVTKQATEEIQKNKTAATAASEAQSKLGNSASRAASAARKSGVQFRSTGSFMDRARNALRGFNKEQSAFIPLSGRVYSGLSLIHNGLRRVGNFRPRLIPPFVALIPLIAGLLALLNPLVALLSAVSAAAFGAASSLLSVGGAIIGLVPIIAAAVAGISSLIVAFNGIGGVFSAWGAVRDSMGVGGGGGGGGGPSAADRAWDAMKAEERLSDAQENALDAQQDLNQARRDAVRRLEDLRRAVAGAALSEAEAAADIQQARENYFNVMADPGSTAGDKADALTRLQRAEQSLLDLREEAKRNVEDLNDAEKKGIEGDEGVVRAKRRVRDSLREVRDATRALNKQLAGGGAGGGGGASPMDKFNEALAKLSPSAQKVVLALIAMGDQWRELQRTVQEAFFSEIVDDMGRLESMLPTIEYLLSRAAGAMGRFTSDFIKLVSSSEWKADLLLISDQNVVIIENLGRAILGFSQAMKDLVVAAGPFAIDLTNSFANLNESFSNIIADARADGSLAAWLDKVYARLQQWWRIIKNVAQTLFNYGAAASDFGQWITDGLEAMTGRWLDSSKEAREAGSPFQEYLENIKPVLTEVRGLIGDFFGWIARVSSDEDVLSELVSILQTLRDDLGPSLASFFDTLTDSGIGTKFVEGVASLVESLDAILAAGGIEGFSVFFDMITGFFSWLADVANDPAFAPFVSTFAKFAGALAALSFIGKFTGLTNLFGWLLRLTQTAGLFALVKALPGLAALKGVGGLLGGGAAAGAGGAAAGGAAGGAAAGGLALPVLTAIAAAIVTQLLAKDAANAAARGITSDSRYADSSFGGTSEQQLSTQIQISQQTGGMVLPGNWMDEMNGAEKAAEKVYENVDEIGRAALRATNSMDKLRESRGISDEYQEQLNTELTLQEAIVAAYDKRREATKLNKEALEDAVAAESAALSALDQALIDNGENWNNGSEGAERNRLAVLNFADASYETAESMRKNGASYEEYEGKIEDSRQAIIDSIVAMGGSRTSARQLAEQILKIPTQRQFNLQNNIDDTKRKVQLFKDVWDGRRITTTYWIELGYDKAAAAEIARYTGMAQSYLSGARGAVGGLVPQYLSAGGRVRKLNQDRARMDPRGTDKIPAMLTPGEYVVKESRVREVGAENLQAFNDGMLSFAGLASLSGKAAASQSSRTSQMASAGYKMPSVSPSTGVREAAQAAMVESGPRFGDVNIYNPRRERATDSLQSAVRKVAYAGPERRPHSKRLDDREDEY